MRDHSAASRSASARHIDEFHKIDATAADAVVRTRMASADDRRAVLAQAEVAIGALAEDTVIARVMAHDPASLWVFEGGGVVRGGVALLLLNAVGHDALLAGRLDRANPDLAHLCGEAAEPSAIYLWALLAKARAWFGLAQTAAIFSAGRYSKAPYYAHAATEAGARAIVRFGFAPVPAAPGLFRTERRVFE